jgi:hypothetical protein
VARVATIPVYRLRARVCGADSANIATSATSATGTAPREAIAKHYRRSPHPVQGGPRLLAGRLP